MSAYQQALHKLLNDLTEIAEDHEEIFDTDCREQLFDAVFAAFIKPKEAYVLTDKYGLYEAQGNARVKTALETYINTVKPLADQENLSAQARLDVFQDSGDAEISADEFFGWLESVD